MRRPLWRAVVTALLTLAGTLAVLTSTELPARAHANLISYKITPAHRQNGNGTCVNAKTAGEIELRACQGAPAATLWQLQPATSGGDLYRVVNAETGRCLESLVEARTVQGGPCGLGGLLPNLDQKELWAATWLGSAGVVQFTSRAGANLCLAAGNEGGEEPALEVPGELLTA